MLIGVCTIRIGIPNSFSLKDKRQVCLSLTTRIRQRFNVSVAEYADLDSYRWASFAIVSVNTEKSFLNSTLSKVVELIKGEPSVVIEKYNIEIL